MATLPLIPFAKLPRKEWKNVPVTEGGELKPRIDLKTLLLRDDNSDDEENYEEDEIDDDSNASSEGYDLLQHLADLLPGEVTNGRKPVKEANLDHLADLKNLPPPSQRFKTIKAAYKWVMTMRARERTRRKHHVLLEYEKLVREFDGLQQQIRSIALQEYEKEIKQEEYRRIKQIDRNSRKKIAKAETTLFFTRDFHLREKEALQLQFYCEHFPDWYIEGQKNQEVLVKQQQEKVESDKQRLLTIQEAKQHAQLIAVDQQLLADDKALTGTIEGMMVQYGVLSYDPPQQVSEQQQVEQIFVKNAKHQAKLRQKQAVIPDESRLDLRIDKSNPELNLPALKTELRRHRFNKIKKGPNNSNTTPFTGNIDFSDTGDIHKVRAYEILEVGALSFAAEISSGACPLMKQLSLLNCRVHDSGWARIALGMKLANLFTLQSLDLRGNCLTALSLDYYRDLCPSGIFSSLEVLDMSNNELGDAGIDALVRVITIGHLRSMVSISLQRNAISDRGFSKLCRLLYSVKDVQCPRLTHLGLELNLITAECKQMWAPIPTYISC